MTTRDDASRGRLAIVGLDGATFRVLDPLIEAGAMPALAALRARGAEGILRSTVPTYTPPAWVSMATGVNPGRHGVFGFLASTPQEPPSIAHSGSIRATTMWRFLGDLGHRVGAFHVPMTYPAVPVNGFMVAGGLAAGWTDPEMPNYGSDPGVTELVHRVAGGRYPVDTQVDYENDWRTPETVTRVQNVQVLRRRVLAELLAQHDPRALFAVFEGPDRLFHVFYQYLVEGSDWFDAPPAAEVRDRTHAYFAELDRTIGDIVDWAGEDGHVVIVSDHGAGPLEKTLNLNLLLEEWGFLRLPGVSRLTRLGAVAGAGQRLARRIVPRPWLHRAKQSVQRRIVWDDTRAFASHIPEQGVHVNVRDAMPLGVVATEEVAAIEREITERLLEVRDPDDGGPVVDRVYRRDEVIAGPYAARAPHLFPMLRDQRYELSDTLAASGPFTDNRDRPWGYHHLDGVFIAAGPSVRPGRIATGLDIVDALPTSLALARLPVPEGLDGRVLDGVAGSRAEHVRVTAAVGDATDASDEYPFTAEDEEAIAESLRGLGYLE
jgi:predicted AlkP superfamily phosphohydrolase/phosphomutase